MNDDQRLTHLAKTIHDFRSSRGLSLDEMAGKSGVSRSMICQIEGEQTNPTLAVLGKLARAMEISLGQLVDPETKPTLYRLESLKSAKTQVHSKDQSFLCSLLSEGSRTRQLDIHAFRFLKPGVHVSQGHGPRASEFLFMTKGKMQLEVAGEAIELREGDLLEFGAASEHVYRQLGKDFAEGLCVVHFS